MKKFLRSLTTAELFDLRELLYSYDASMQDCAPTIWNKFFEQIASMVDATIISRIKTTGL